MNFANLSKASFIFAEIIVTLCREIAKSAKFIALEIFAVALYSMCGIVGNKSDQNESICVFVYLIKTNYKVLIRTDFSVLIYEYRYL